MIGIPTGFKIIDKGLGGLRTGHLIVLSAYTNVGKSTFMMNIVNNVMSKTRVVIISLEMSKQDMFAKLVAINKEMPISKVYSAGTNDVAYEDYKKAREDIINADVAMYTEKNTVEDIVAIMRIENEKSPVGLFCIDYVQNIVGTGNETEYETIRKATATIQHATSQLKTTTLLLSQISNEGRKASEMSINGKGSGSLRAASDMFLYLNYREKEDDELLKQLQNDTIDMEITANKNRHGKLGQTKLVRNSLTGNFYQV
jgi:replicative DNA helicase